MNIRLFKKSDWSQVKTIYQLGIDTGVATFETTPPANVSLWLAKINPKLTFVLEEGDELHGWITLSKISSRCVYEGVGEISIYVHPHYQKRHVGKLLYRHLETEAKNCGYWTLQAQLFTENLASKEFFEKQGFRQVGTRKRIGQLENRWIDNYLYEKSL